MKKQFEVEPGLVVECEWKVSGKEVYRVNNQVVLEASSLAIRFQRELTIPTDGGERRVVLRSRFRPGLRSLLFYFGMAVEVSVDGQLLIADLLADKYTVRSALGRVVRAVNIALAGLLVVALLLFVFAADLIFPRSESIRITNAALADAACYDALDEHADSLVVPLSEAREYRAAEMARHGDWFVDHGSPVVHVVTTILPELPSPCRSSALALLDRYLVNGADIDVRHPLLASTPLEDAIMVGSAGLVCELLQRGAALDKRVTRRRSDGSPSPITGKSLAELAVMQADRIDHPDFGKTVRVIEQFKTAHSCNPP